MKRASPNPGTTLGLAIALLAAGCASVPRAAPRQPVARARDSAAAPVRAPAIRQLAVRIESRPSGALIVVGERVLGHAPVTVLVGATPTGFFTGRVAVRARFLATDPRHESVSVPAEFTPLDKVPARLVFTPGGVQRVAR